MNLNKCFILGRLTREPETRCLPSGTQVCNLGVATDSFSTNKETNEKKQKVEFHNIVLFSKLAETASKYLHKGGLVLIEGRLSTREWVDANGLKHYRTEIIADNMQLGPKTGETDYKKYDDGQGDVEIRPF